MPAGGGRVKTLTSASAGVYARWPAWAPEGATIVFSRSVGSAAFASELYLVDPAGTSTGQLTHLDGANTSPAWSPDGTRIAFAHFGGSVLGDGIFSIRRDGTDVRLVTDQTSAFDPAWSPDGSRIAFESAGEGGTYLYLVGAVGGPAVRVPVQVGDFSHPSWSPDGSRIAYEAPDGDVHSAAADGSGDVDLPSSPG